MVMPVAESVGGLEALRHGSPGIRFLKVPRKTGFPVESEFTAEDLEWNVVNAGVPSRKNQIAAVAFYFAEALHNATGHPIGIVQSSYGGTPAEAWTSLDMLEGLPELNHYAIRSRTPAWPCPSTAVKRTIFTRAPSSRWASGATGPSPSLRQKYRLS
jgi:hypothetical protein